MKGVHSGLRLPESKEATSDARCPTVRPLASTTYHFRLPARSLPLGKYVDIVNYLCFKRIKRERLEYKPLGKVVKADGSLVNAFIVPALGYAKNPGLVSNPGLNLVNAVGVVG